MDNHITIIAFYFGTRTVKEAREVLKRGGGKKVSFKLKKCSVNGVYYYPLETTIPGVFEANLRH